MYGKNALQLIEEVNAAFDKNIEKMKEIVIRAKKLSAKAELVRASCERGRLSVQLEAEELIRKAG